MRHEDRFRDEVGAYVLGALDPDEARAFERHLEGCPGCREELDALRPAADLLPRSVEPVAPPASLKASLMEIVEREAHERRPAARAAPPRSSLRERLAAALSGRRSTLAWAIAAVALLAGVAGGIGVAGLLSGDDTRTLQAAADERRLARVSGTLTIADGGGDGGILRLHRLPSAGPGRVYQAWVQRDGAIVPQPTFEPARDGDGSVAITADLADADAVLVTRERRGGARTPSEQPVVSVTL